MNNLLLAAVGLYGVLAYSIVCARARLEYAWALGAEPGRIACLIVGQGYRLVAGGAFALTRFLESLIYGVSAIDPATFIVVTALLMSMALIASYLPARRGWPQHG